MSDAGPAREQNGSQEVDVRLSEIEVRPEVQARTVEDLDAIVREFAERVARLEGELRELRQQLEVLSSDDEPTPVVP